MRREFYIAILCVLAIFVLLVTTDDLRVFLLNCLLFYALFISSNFFTDKIFRFLTRGIIYFFLILNILDFIAITFTDKISYAHPFFVSVSLAVPWLSFAYFIFYFFRRAREFWTHHLRMIISPQNLHRDPVLQKYFGLQGYASPRNLIPKPSFQSL